MLKKYSLKNVSKKSYLGAILFALALWLYTSLGSDYTTLVNLPVIIRLPEDRAFEEPPPRSVMIEAKGTGWNLFNLLYFNKSKRVFIDLYNTRINSPEYDITRTAILKGLQAFDRVELSDVLTDGLNILTGKVTTYSVPVEPVLNIIPGDGFTLVGKPKLEPDVIEIRGNDKIVSTIKNWKTKPAVFENRNSSFIESLELSDSLDGIINLSKRYVKFTAEIQQTAEVTFDEVKISVRGGIVPKNHFLYPEHVSITFRGGIEEIIQLNPDKISVTLNYADIVNNKTGILVPKVEYPGNSEVIIMSPNHIYNYKIIKSDDLSNINF
ncbi:MAG: hypothetical protein WC313_12590 [Candidatus Kapaibacterium sp.]